MIGFGKQDIRMSKWQEAKWIGGKKNDLVLCFGDGWAYVFGWTDKELVKRNLETILLNNDINNDILPKIREEVVKNYTIKDWDDFNYISVEPPSWSYWVFILVMILTQGGLYVFFHLNEFRK